MAFSLLEREVIDSFTAYRKDLEQTANKLEITNLPRNEQLAFWINLHNVALAEQIALNWPVREPENLALDGQRLHDAPFLNVAGVPLSLRDIRTRIVYPHWRDPRVLYGFWQGTIGGPSLQREAFNADNIDTLLGMGAREFVNSLRGVQRRGDTMLVSEIYVEAAPFYFTDFETGLRAHLNRFAHDEVKEILSRTTRSKASIRVPDIADLAGGMREPSTTPVTVNGRAALPVSPSIARLLQERAVKLREMGRARTGTVRVESSEDKAAKAAEEVR